MKPICDLQNKRCVPCEGGIPPLPEEKIRELLQRVPQWELNNDATCIQRRYTFKGFYKTMAFVNAVAWIANQENHHPDMEMGFNYCVIKYTTHAIKGLTENDFICAAKINELLE